MSARSLIMLHEGLRLTPYLCSAGRLTIGYGRNLEDRGITAGEAAFLLDSDLRDVTQSLDEFSWFSGLSIVRQAVVTDMVFNLGISGFCQFQRMIRALELSDFDAAAAEMLDSRWAAQVGQRSARLARMMRENNWPREVEVSNGVTN